LWLGLRLRLLLLVFVHSRLFHNVCSLQVERQQMVFTAKSCTVSCPILSAENPTQFFLERFFYQFLSFPVAAQTSHRRRCQHRNTFGSRLKYWVVLPTGSTVMSRATAPGVYAPSCSPGKIRRASFFALHQSRLAAARNRIEHPANRVTGRLIHRMLVAFATLKRSVQQLPLRAPNQTQ